MDTAGGVGDTRGTTQTDTPLPEDPSRAESNRACTGAENPSSVYEESVSGGGPTQGVVEHDSKGVQTSSEDQVNRIIREANEIIQKQNDAILTKDQDLFNLRQEYINGIRKRDKQWEAELRRCNAEHLEDVQKVENLTSELARKKADLERVLGERLDNVDDYQPLIDADLRDPFLKLRSKVRLFASKHCRAGDKLSLGVFKSGMKKYTLTSNISDRMWDKERRAIIQSVIWRRLLDDIFADPVMVFSMTYVELSKFRKELFPSGRRRL